MQKRKPGIKKALDFLVEGINAQRFGKKLPSIRLLARKADVSFVTMWKAVQQLKAQDGLANPVKGKAVLSPPSEDRAETYAIETSDSDHGAEYGGALWLKLKIQMQKDILTGSFTQGAPLPSIKEMQNRYNASFPTIKKSLEALEAEGIIKSQRRGYIVPALTSADRNDRIVAIGCGWEDAKIWSDFQDKAYFRILEAECIQSKIGLDIAVYFPQNGRLNYFHTATRAPYNLKKDNVLGIAYIVANLAINPEEILKDLLQVRKPIAVLDVVGGWKIPDYLMNHRDIQFFTVTASRQPGKQAAKYLLSLGHSHIAFFSPFHKALWSQRRYEGLNEIYQAAGHTGDVVPYVLKSYSYQWDFLRYLDKKDDIRSFFAQYLNGSDKQSQKMLKKFGNIRSSISQYLTERNCANNEINQKMMPLFRRALSDQSVTAWVFSNDFAATLALDYLKDAGLQIPQDMSVFSFDNTIDAMEYQLTSYDFNNGGIINAMLRYIISPSTFPEHPVVEVDGTIVLRSSTGHARKGPAPLPPSVAESAPG